MHETDDDLDRLQRLLDHSHAQAGDHTREILTDATRLSATELVELLTGVQVLTVATVTADGRPRAAPVDGLFHRGAWWFGTSPASLRHRHLQRSPHVSAAHVRGEDLVVLAHGRALPVDLGSAAGASFAAACREVYGRGWDGWGGDAPYYRVEADRLLASDVSVLRQPA